MSIPGYLFAPPLDAWQEQPQLARAVEDLSSFARLILWDPRGTGLSDRFARAHPIEDEIADAVAVLDAVESDRAVLLGWAWSGLPAMLLAAMRPDRTAGLVLFNSFATTFRAPDYPWGQTREEWKADVQGIAIGGDPRWSWTGSRRASGERTLPGMVGHDGDAVREPAGRPGVLRGARGDRRRPALSLISSPTLVLHRPASFMQVENARYLAEHIPGSVDRELPGADGIAGWMAGPAVRRSAIVTGNEPEEAYESVLATVLFTDIVGSTEMVTRPAIAVGQPSPATRPLRPRAGTVGGTWSSGPGTGCSRRSRVRPARSGARRDARPLERDRDRDAKWRPHRRALQAGWTGPRNRRSRRRAHRGRGTRGGGARLENGSRPGGGVGAPTPRSGRTPAQGDPRTAPAVRGRE